VHPNSRNIAFGSSNNAYNMDSMTFDMPILWVSLIEKAWAKLCGSYERIIMGTLDMGFIHLCGVPSLSFKCNEYLNKQNDIWYHLQDSQRKKYIMAAGTADKNRNVEQLMANGLRANHCYSILSVHDVRSTQRSQETIRLLKLRNPWGQGEWNGAWCDSSSLWTNELRAQVGITQCEDGIFCMTLQDYLKNFSNTNICKYSDDSQAYYAFKNQPVPPLNFFEFEIEQDFASKNVSLDILVNQMGNRLKKRNGDGAFNASWFSIMLIRQEGNSN